jgi:hypothetical protein
MGRQVKSPVQWVVQTTRSFELSAVPTIVALRTLRDLGQVLFLPPNVKGWDGGKSWITTSTLLHRYNNAPALLGLDGGNHTVRMRRIEKFAAEQGFRPEGAEIDLNRLFPDDLRRSPVRLVDALCERAFGPEGVPSEREAFLAYAKSHPAMTDTDIVGLFKLVLGTPRFQVC